MPPQEAIQVLKSAPGQLRQNEYFIKCPSLVTIVGCTHQRIGDECSQQWLPAKGTHRSDRPAD
ncbi:hypothetical protein GO730_03025 [Spirosoma sp. HMF3257]|uniref:hypothetical protein n=1 Tax=Spirosoma telluris TaxID=2183553 RepID=UPI0011B93959|nr:hypothetical protein [Spirosoma telluris]